MSQKFPVYDAKSPRRIIRMAQLPLYSFRWTFPFNPIKSNSGANIPISTALTPTGKEKIIRKK